MAGRKQARPSAEPRFRQQHRDEVGRGNSPDFFLCGEAPLPRRGGPWIADQSRIEGDGAVAETRGTRNGTDSHRSWISVTLARPR